MARVPIVAPNVEQTNSNHYPGAQNGPAHSEFSRDQRNNNSVAKKVMNSPAYRSAYEVLSKETDKSWLQRLEMIPYSVADASSTFLDELGLTNNRQDKQDANYQYCMQQISALMAEYQQWKNSLPVTQSQQFADAGVNSAITGQGLSSSDISTVGVSSDPSSVRSTNVADFVGVVVDKFLSASSGMLDWISKFNDISMQKRRFSYDQDSSFANFVKELSDGGVVLPDNVKSFTDLINSDDKSWYDTASARAKSLFDEFMEIRNMDAYGHTIVDRTLKGDYRSGRFYSYDDKDDIYRTRFGSVSGASIDVAEYSKNIANLQYNLWLKDLEYKSEYAKQKKEWHDENGYTNAEDIEYFASEIAALDKTTKQYERDKMKIYVDYLKQLKKESDNGNLSSRIQLMDALYELNSTSQFADLGDELYQLIWDLLNK